MRLAEYGGFLKTSGFEGSAPVAPDGAKKTGKNGY